MEWKRGGVMMEEIAANRIGKPKTMLNWVKRLEEQESRIE